MAISGVGVGFMATGGLLLWAGIKNEQPVDLLKQVLGRPSDHREISTPLGDVVSGIRSQATGVTAAGAAAAAAVGAIAGAGSGDLVTEARKHLGARYVWNASGPTTFDCSGLVVYCCRHTRWPKAPRFYTYTFGAWAKSAGWSRITLAQAGAGDVIVKAGHMAIAVSNTRMIAAPHTGDVVKEQTIYSRAAWWGWRPPTAAASIAATAKSVAKKVS